MLTLAVLGWSSIGLAVDFGISYAILKAFINQKATFTELAFFETIHNSISFGLAFFLGFSVLSLSSTDLDISIGLLVTWTLVSVGLAYVILGLHKPKQVGAFITFDTALDYFMGGIFAVPAAATLLPNLSQLAPQVSNFIALGPLTMLEGPVILVAVALVQRRLHEKVQLVADA